MNLPADRSNLPWLAAGTAMLVVLLWHCLTFSALVLRAPSDNEQILGALSMTLRMVGEGLLVQGGLAFLVAQWRGERRQEWAFRRPMLLMALFALGLLAWSVLTMLLYQGLFLWLGTALTVRGLQVWLSVLGWGLAPLSVWASWRVALLACRKDRLATPPPSGLRPRAAGLAAWMQATATIAGVSLAMPLVNTFDAYSTAGWLGTWAGALAAAAFAFGGAWLALPRHLSQVRAGRLLGASLLAFVCAWIVLAGACVAGLILLFGGSARDDTLLVALFVVIAVLPPLGMLGFQWLWTRLLYASLRRAATA